MPTPGAARLLVFTDGAAVDFELLWSWGEGDRNGVSPKACYFYLHSAVFL